MLNAIIDWSARNRFLVLLATLFVVLAGIFAILRTPIDALPDLSDVQVIVYTEYPGQAPQVVVAANFLIDAESNLQAAIGGFGGSVKTPESESGKAPAPVPTVAAPAPAAHQEH